jgi:hypothetical protein
LASASSKCLPVIAVPAPRARRGPDHARQLAILLSQSVGCCTFCRTRWSDKGKRSWPTRELAEAFRSLAGDLSVEVYACPASSGESVNVGGTVFHLGHLRKIESPTPQIETARRELSSITSNGS